MVSTFSHIPNALLYPVESGYPVVQQSSKEGLIERGSDGLQRSWHEDG